MQRLLLATVLLSLATAPAFARDHGNDRVSTGSDITVAEGETVSDIVCAFCSVHIHGDVTGDVVAFLGNVTVDSDRGIRGDTAIMGGDLNLGERSFVGGDVSIMAGDANLASGATIGGSRTIMPGRFWLILPLIPLLIPIALIWLIVYLVRRRRYRFPVYPQGRGI